MSIRVLRVKDPRQAGAARAYGIAIALIVTILFYTGIGIASNAGGIVVYDDFPRNPFYPTKAYTLTIRNNNALNINPTITPLFLAYIESTNATCTYAWEGNPECNQSTIDVGKIDPGQSYRLPINVQPEKRNFTIKISVHLNLWNVFRISAGSRSIHFKYLTNGTYLKE